MVFDEEELKKGQKLVTKLRNAFQFVKMQLEGANRNDFMNEKYRTEITKKLYPTDQRIRERLMETVQNMNKHLDNFEY
jgi:valyl-tRNA synthetase